MKSIKILSLLVALFFISNAMAQKPIPGNDKVDGLKPTIPVQVIKPMADITPAKPVTANSPNSPANDGSQVLPKANKFKSIALNNNNGGVWLIGEDNRLYGTAFHYQSIGTTVYLGEPFYVENLTSFRGQASMRNLSGIGMMTNGFAGPESVRKSAEAWAGFPTDAKYFYGDKESIYSMWYIDGNNIIRYFKNGGADVPANLTPPKKEAKMFTVYNNEFFMIDLENNLWRWKPSYTTEWKRYNDVKAKFITTDVGISTPLWYIGMDDLIYVLYNDDFSPAVQGPDTKTVRSITAFGSQLHVIGTDGFYYLRVKNDWIKVDL